MTLFGEILSDIKRCRNAREKRREQPMKVEIVDMEDLVQRVFGLHEKIVADVPQLTRGQVWCRHCGSTRKVNSADCLRHGWPKCCGYTMTLDSPEEQARQP